MDIRLTDSQMELRDSARQFAAQHLMPFAARIDEEQSTPASLLTTMKQSGYLGAALPGEWGGGGMDPLSYGLVTEEIGSVCSSIRSLMTVHNMCAQAIIKVGTRSQRERWLPDLCVGNKIIAFALSEPNVGSATRSIEAEATKRGHCFLLKGIKKWITYGQIADLYLVFVRCGNDPIGLIVDRSSEHLEVEPIRDMVGTRGSMLAQLRFDDVLVPQSHQIGAQGLGLTFVANTALDHGRFSVAWGSLGIIRACLDACLSYTEVRWQGGEKLKDYQLIRAKLADVLVGYTAARALCSHSACLREMGDPRAIMETSMAKYLASETAMKAATEAVHIHGANGCSSSYPVSRYLRDATVAGIIEGTREIHQMSLADYAFQRSYMV